MTQSVGDGVPDVIVRCVTQLKESEQLWRRRTREDKSDRWMMYGLGRSDGLNDAIRAIQRILKEEYGVKK